MGAGWEQARVPPLGPIPPAPEWWPHRKFWNDGESVAKKE